MKRKLYVFISLGILLVFSIMFCIHIRNKNDLDKVAQKEPETLMKETELAEVQEERERSGVPAEENDWAGDVEDDVEAMCELVRTMDFTVEKPHMGLTEEEDLAYKEAFLHLLKNELPIEGWYEGEDCYQDLWRAGIPYENLLEERDSAGFPYFYYYDDIDGDGKPEFGVSQGAVYFFDYELGEEACSVSYCGQSIYFAKLLGVGKMLEYDCQHAWVERFQYIVLNSDGEWETVLDLQLYFAEDEEETIFTKYYFINGVDVGKENWEELTAPFFRATECEIPKKSLTEVFGTLLEEGR